MTVNAIPNGNLQTVRPIQGDLEGRYVLLDGLRGVAAFAIILDHIPSGPIGALFPGRYLGVQFFFVLSGFVMAHAYGRRLAAGMSVWALMRVRLIRLYPLYLLGFAIALAVNLYYVFKGWRDFSPLQLGVWTALGALMLPSPLARSGALYPLNGPSWTLFFELVANFIYGLTARRLTGRVFAIILPISGAVMAWTCFEHPLEVGPWQWACFDMGLSGVIYDFFMGVLIYRLNAKWRLPALPAGLAFVAFAAVIMAPLQGVWRQGWDALAAVLLMPLIVAAFANSKVDGRLGKACAIFGMLSYGIYILHVPLAGAMAPVIQKFTGAPPQGVIWYFAVAAVAAATVAIAQDSYDRPMRKLLARLWTPKLSPRAATPDQERAPP